MANPIELKLNPDLDPADFAEAYAKTKLVRIPNILADDAANAIHDVLARGLEWRLVFPEPPQEDGGRDQIVYLTQADVRAMGREALMHRLRGVEQRASKNIGFLYSAYPMIEAYMKGWDPDHPIHHLTEFLNSEEFLRFGAAVIGAEKPITKADAQATLYSPGHFLTRHTDEGFSLERRAAYTFGFTKTWEPDWGGLLAFLDGDLDVTRALMPRFNVLSLFDGRMVHSVTPVSRFAAGPRLQITGWLRDD